MPFLSFGSTRAPTAAALSCQVVAGMAFFLGAAARDTYRLAFFAAGATSKDLGGVGFFDETAVAQIAIKSTINATMDRNWAPPVVLKAKNKQAMTPNDKRGDPFSL